MVAMKLRAAIALAALLALAAPALAQRGGAHAGSFSGHGFAGTGSGFAGHAGFSARPGFSGSGRSVSGRSTPSAPPFRSGAMGRPGLPRYGQPGYAGARIPYTGSRAAGYRPAHGLARPSRAGDSDGDRDRDRFGERRREFDRWYTEVYPAWLGYGYPYTIDPGFFDWGDNGDFADSNAADESPEYDQGPAPLIYPPYPNLDEEGARPSYTGSAVASAPTSDEPLTVVFKDGRAPVKMQNYMMTATVLTDLDPQQYRKIPLDEIDLAATQRTNSAAGVDFRVPGAVRD
jgi:hypothetical protein